VRYGRPGFRLGAVDDFVAPALARLLEVSLGSGEEGGRGLTISWKGHDSRAEGQPPWRLLRTSSKLHPPDPGSHTLGDTDRFRMTRVKQQYPHACGKATHNVRGANELGDADRERRLDRFLELGVFRGDVRLEDAESEEVPVSRAPAGLAKKEVEEGLVLEQARGRIKKGHDPAPFPPCAERCVDMRLEVANEDIA